MHVVRRNTCRVCGSSALTKVISLGEQCLQGSFVKPGKELPSSRRIEMTLVRCDPTQSERACGLLQMQHSVPPEILYSGYWYRSGTNDTMRNHLRGIVDEAVSIVRTASGCALDIGCNDGTLLNSYPSTFRKFGVDPSDIARGIEGEITVINDIFPSDELIARLNGGQFDVVTSIAMFYDLEDPVGFSKAVKSVLSKDGIWIFEMSYMPSMLRMNSYDTICHEHLEYYSLAVIEYVLKAADLRLFDARLNDINGGSIRCYATHADNFKYKTDEGNANLTTLRHEEFDMELDTDKPYRHFQDQINVHREELNRLLKSLKKEGKTIHVYGASTKGNTIMQWCGIDHRIIEVAADRNPDKHGAYTLGTDIPIVSEEKSRAMRPDYYLVLPWHFKEEFLRRERETVARGTALIFPLPKIEIITTPVSVASAQMSA